VPQLLFNYPLSNSVLLLQIVLVDKSVLVNRAALSEPSDVFVRSAAAARQNGNKMTPQTITRRLSESCPRMDSICEGSDEGSSSSEGEAASTVGSSSFQRRLSPVVSPGRSVRSTAGNGGRLQMNERSGFVAGAQHKRPGANSVVERGRICSVEAGTNTSSVERHDKSTITDGICSVMLDGKMAECISKLRTVSQRLEQQQPSTPRTSSPPETTAAATTPQPMNQEPSPPPIIPPPTASSQVTTGVADSVASKDGSVEQQEGDQEDEVQQFISELKSRASQETSFGAKRPVQSVPGRRFVVDRKRAGNLSRLDHVPECPASSPRLSRRSAQTDERPSPYQRSYSPRAVRNHGARPTTVSSQDAASPTQRRSAATKKPAGVSSPPTRRTVSRVPPPPTTTTTDSPPRPRSTKADLTTSVGLSKIPGSSPAKVRPARTATTKSAQLAAVDDDQAKSTSDSDSLLTHSGSSDDQEPTSGVARPPATPTLARKQRLDMNQLLLLKSASLADQQTGTKQVRESPTTTRRTCTTNHRQN